MLNNNIEGMFISDRISDNDFTIIKIKNNTGYVDFLKIDKVTGQIIQMLNDNRNDKLNIVDYQAQTFGINQTWTNVSSRAFGVTYTNTTGKPIMVCVNQNFVPQAGASLRIVVNGNFIDRVWIGSGGPSGTGALNVSAIVPHGNTYFADTSGTLVADTLSWMELR